MQRGAKDLSEAAAVQLNAPADGLCRYRPAGHELEHIFNLVQLTLAEAMLAPPLLLQRPALIVIDGPLARGPLLGCWRLLETNHVRILLQIVPQALHARRKLRRFAHQVNIARVGLDHRRRKTEPPDTTRTVVRYLATFGLKVSESNG